MAKPIFLFLLFCITITANSADTTFIESSCSVTTYPELCVQSLSLYATSIQQNQHQLVQTALSVSLDTAQSIKSFVNKLTKFKGLKRREFQAIKDCLEEVDDTVDKLSKSMKEMQGMSAGNRGEEFQWHMSNIETWVSAALTDENTCFDRWIGNSKLIQLHFHDCFVQGCDASILLDESPTIQSEQTSFSNNNSIGGLDIIAAAKTDLESICPGVVSCADILAVAARDASEAVNGPTWTVNLGRRDSTTASRALADVNIPLATDSLDSILRIFRDKGLNARDTVALSGSHTIGQARCVTFRGRIYNNTSIIDPDFAATRRQTCPQNGSNGISNLAPLDLVTPNNFDNNYYKNVIANRGLLASDQALLSNGGSTARIVQEYSKNPSRFSSDFAAAMIKMGNIAPPRGSRGQIRNSCNLVN